jgi:hypothetical protein
VASYLNMKSSWCARKVRMRKGKQKVENMIKWIKIEHGNKKKEHEIFFKKWKKD